MTEVEFQDQLLHGVNVRLFRLGIAATVTILGLALALAVVALRPKAPPYVIALDNGRIVGYAHVFTASDTMAPEIVEHQIRSFIVDAREIADNPDLELHNIHAMYAFTRGQATAALDAYFRGKPDRDPVLLAKKGDWRDVHIVRCLPEPEVGTWRIQWTETFHRHDTTEVLTTSWEATLKIVVTVPDPNNEYDPLGIYATSLNWAPEA